MKILYLHSAKIDSQLANLIQVKSMCEAMGRIGYDVTLSLPAGGSIEAGSFSTVTSGYKLIIRNSGYKNQRFDKYLNQTSVKKVINEINPDFCYIRSPVFLDAVSSLNKKFIYELHNHKLHTSFFIDQYWKFKFTNASNKKIFKRIVCISQALSDYWIKKGLPEDKILTAHDGFNPQLFVNMMGKEKARGKIGLPQDKKILVYTGRLYKDRKIENIIILAEKFPEALFVVVGGPEEQKKYYTSLSNSRGISNIKFTGQIPHSKVSEYLSSSDVLLGLWSADVPTINYCSPLKIFEYMAAGKTIVAHSFPTIREVLSHKKNAMLCAPDSIDDLVEKTEAAIRISEENNMGKQARADAFEKYSWDKRVINIFEGLSAQF